MNGRKYEIMEKYIKGEYTVSDMIQHIVELEARINDLNQIIWNNGGDIR